MADFGRLRHYSDSDTAAPIAVVGITVRGQELAYRDTQTFTARDVLLSSNEDVIGTVPVTLYFLNEAGKLAPEERTLDLYEGDTQPVP